MNTIATWAGGAGLALLAWCGAASAAPGRYALDPAGTEITFAARTTVHGVEGTAAQARGDMVFDPQTGQLAGPAQVRIPVAAMDTGNGPRDRSMRRMFEAAEFPELVFTVEQLTRLEAPAAGRPQRYRLAGRLRIRTLEQPVEIEVEAVPVGEDLDVSGRVMLTTTMFRLKPPTALGVMRVKPGVQVSFSSRWVRQP